MTRRHALRSLHPPTAQGHRGRMRLPVPFPSPPWRPPCCSPAAARSGGGTAAGTSTSAAGSSTASAASSSLAAAAASRTPQAGCPSVGRSIPAGAQSKQTIDVDGDGRPDTEWIATSARRERRHALRHPHRQRRRVLRDDHSASPVARSVMFADVTGHGEIIALASDGRQVLLYAVSRVPADPREERCRASSTPSTWASPATAPAWAAWTRTATARPTWSVSSTCRSRRARARSSARSSKLDGPNARNGATDTVTATRPEHGQEAHSVSCGDQTMAANGVSTGP